MKKKYIISIAAALMISTFIGALLYARYRIDTSSGELTIVKKNKYDASEEIKQALSSLNENKKAEVITDFNVTSDVVAVAFEGLADKTTMATIRELLDRYGIKATFFIPGIKAAEDPSIVEAIKNDGHEIGNGTLSCTKNMEKLTVNDLVADFVRTNNILKAITGEAPVLLKCNSTVYNDSILSAAIVSGSKYVLDSKHYLSYQSYENYEQAFWYIKNMKKGTVITVKLEGVLDSLEYGKEKKEETPMVDKQVGLEEKTNKEKKQVTITQTVEWLLKSIDEQNRTVIAVSDFTNAEKYMKIEQNSNLGSNSLDKEAGVNLSLVNFKKLIEKNNKRQAAVISEFYTTQEALAYTFRGLSNATVLDKVLNTLDRLNAKGTFFVTKDEIINYPDRITKILNKGHEIGNGGITTGSSIMSKPVEEICKEIYIVDTMLKERGIITNAYMGGYGYKSNQIQEALSALKAISTFKNYELFTYTKAPIVNKYKDKSAEEIISSYFDVNLYKSLRKGEIVYFRLDSDLFKDEQVVANMLELITKNYVQSGYINRYNSLLKDYDLVQKSLGYSVVTLGRLQKTKESPGQLGRYNFAGSVIPMRMRAYEEAVKMMNTNYVGNKYVDLSDFSEEEKQTIDKEGIIDTKGESVIFLTFDDWGSDPVVNGILDVLKKHKVNGSFFVISKYTDADTSQSNANPNLLRTIAFNGNDIGSHNYNHELLGTDRQELEKSLIKSYEVMAKVVGDLNSLRPYFRPPTLLLRKEGLAAVFESGYKYSISGSITTHDYERPSAQDIVSYIEKGLVKNKGNVVVMHMNDQSYFTAEALDILLTNNEKGLDGVKYKIARLSDYLEK
jgi:peptidoglycan-N-acetylglucosamine deacetylase